MKGIAGIVLSLALSSQLSDLQAGAVTFNFVPNTSLVVIPVTVNEHGPYKFLLDTGASHTLLSASVANRLKVPKGYSKTLFSAGGNVPVTMRTLETMQIGNVRMKHPEIAVGNFDLLNTLQVDGIFGADYLRKFKVSIDYDQKTVEIEPCCSDVTVVSPA